MSANPSDDIVRLATALNSAEAHLYEQALRQAGVRCKVVGDYLEAGFGDIPGLQDTPVTTTQASGGALYLPSCPATTTRKSFIICQLTQKPD